MSDSRKSGIPEFEFHPARIIFLKINKALQELHVAFSFAFAEGKEKPLGMNFHRAVLFNQVWSELDVNVPFEDDKELSKYYANISANLEGNIDNYCYEAGLSRGQVSLDFYTMLQKIIQLYGLLAKYRFYLSPFGNADRPETFATKVAKLKAENTNLKKVMEELINVPAEDIIGSLELTLKTTFEKLQQSGYDPDFQLTSDRPPSVQNVISSAVMTQLDRLVTTDRMAESSKKSAANAQAELKAIIVILEDVKIKLLAALKDEIINAEDKSKELTMRSSAFAAKLAYLTEAYHQLDIFRHILLIKGEVKNAPNAGEGYKKLRELAKQMIAECKKQDSARPGLNLWSNVWDVAIEKIQIHLGDILRQFEQFTSAYYVHLSVIKELNESIVQYREHLQKINDQTMRLVALCATAKQVSIKSYEAIHAMQKTLATRAETDLDFLKSFFNRHWVKMVLGGLGAGGTTAAIAMLALALNPVSVSVVALAGTLFGSSIGGSAGLVIDRLKHKNEMEATKTVRL